MKDFPVNNEDHKHKNNMKKLQEIPKTSWIFILFTYGVQHDFHVTGCSSRFALNMMDVTSGSRTYTKHNRCH